MPLKKKNKTEEAKEKEDSSLGWLFVLDELPLSVNIKKGEAFTLGGLQVFAEAQQISSSLSVSSPQSLTIFTCKTTSNAVEMYKQRVDQVANEISHRKEDSAAVTIDIAALEMQAEAGGDDADQVPLRFGVRLIMRCRV